MNVERVVLLPTDDGRWRVTTEGGDSEGHAAHVIAPADKNAPQDAEGHGGHFIAPADKNTAADAEGHIMRRLSIEPEGEDDDGTPLYRVTADGDDVTGHAYHH